MKVRSSGTKLRMTLKPGREMRISEATGKTKSSLKKIRLIATSELKIGSGK